MGHLCFDWTIPPDHMLEKAKAGAGLKGLSLPEKSQPHWGRGKYTGQGSPLPSTEPACSQRGWSGRGLHPARAGSCRPSSPLLGRGGRMEGEGPTQTTEGGRHTIKVRTGHQTYHPGLHYTGLKPGQQTVHGRGPLADRLSSLSL